MFAIARHTRIDVYRRLSRIARHEKVSDELESMKSRSFASPDSSHRDLWKLLWQLPESQREVVKMLKVAGMSVEDIARATGSTAGAVKQRAHRAYQRLRKLLAAQGLHYG